MKKLLWMAAPASAANDPKNVLFHLRGANYWITDAIQNVRTTPLPTNQVGLVLGLIDAEYLVAQSEAVLIGLSDGNFPDPYSTDPIVFAKLALSQAENYLRDSVSFDSTMVPRAQAEVQNALDSLNNLSYPLILPSDPDRTILYHLFSAEYWEVQSELQFLSDTSANIAGNANAFWQTSQWPLSNFDTAFDIIAKVTCDGQYVPCAVAEYQTASQPYEAVNRLILDPEHDPFYGMPYYFRTGAEALLNNNAGASGAQTIGVVYTLRAWQDSDWAAYLCAEAIGN